MPRSTTSSETGSGAVASTPVYRWILARASGRSGGGGLGGGECVLAGLDGDGAVAPR